MASLTAEKDAPLLPTRDSGHAKRSYERPALMQPTSNPWLEGLQQQAAKGNPAAQFMVGHALETGLGGSPDPMGALEWYRKAALQAAKKHPIVP